MSVVELKNRVGSAERILINNLIHVIPITTVEQNNEVRHSNSSDKWDIFQHQCRREGGGGSWYNLPGRGGPEGDPGSDYVAYVVFSAVLLVDCAI
jgi:hypothetical protein